ncbi:MAG TPA: hypothetical protein VKA46_11205 [Gemmataceae bacterium]|nr:hypothetical protein [Gemmataceae bacterium]
MADAITCPVCRARVESGPQCRRCKADLSLLFALEARRDAALAAAHRALAAGQPDKALAAARGAEVLRHGEDAGHLIAAAHLLRREFEAAWYWYAS